ncbi:hypothetical protein ABEQ25_12175, partial [Cutibacterium acnes]
MATHPRVLAWSISWIVEPGGLESVGSQRVGHDLATEQQPKYENIELTLDTAQFKASAMSLGNISWLFSLWVGSVFTHGCPGILRFISSL